MDLLCEEMDFNNVDGFGMVFETEFTLVLVNVKGLGGGGRSAERTDGFKQVLPGDVNTSYCFGGIRNFSLQGD